MKKIISAVIGLIIFYSALQAEKFEQIEKKAFYLKLQGDYKKSYHSFLNLIKFKNKPFILDYIYLHIADELAEYTVNRKNFIDFLLSQKKAQKHLIINDLIDYLLLENYLKNAQIKKAREKYREMGFINKWYILGPFRNENKLGIKKIYQPEIRINISQWYTDDTFYPVKFRKITSSDMPHINLKHYFYPDKNSVAYLLTYIYSPTNQFLTIHSGSDDGIKIWVNDSLILKNDIYRKAYFDTDNVKVFFKKGISKILVKISQNKDDWKLYFRITPKNYIITNYTARVSSISITTSHLTNITEYLDKLKNRSFYKGLYYLYTKNYSESRNLAAENLSEAINREPENPVYLFYYALTQKTLTERKKYLLLSLKNFKNNNEAKLRLSDYYENINDYDTAMYYLNRIHPDNYNKLFSAALILYKKKTLSTDALNIINKLLKLYPDDFSVNFLKAAVLFDINKDESAKYFNKSFKLRPDKFPLLLNHGLIAYNLLHKIDIENLYLEQLKYTGDNIKLYNDLTDYYLYNNLEKAVKYNKIALSINPFNITALKLNSDIMLKLNKKKKAKTSLERILQINPTDNYIVRRLNFLSGNSVNLIDKYKPDINKIVKNIFKKSLLYYRQKYKNYSGIMFLDSSIINISKKGTKEKLITKVYYVLSDNAGETYSHDSVYYSPATTKVEILKAETISRNMKRFNASGIKDYSVVNGDEKLYYDYVARIIKFSNVKADSIIILQYHLWERSENKYNKNYFADTSYWGNDIPTLSKNYYLITHYSTPIYFKYFYFSSKKPYYKKIKAGKYRIYKWAMNNLKIIDKEPKMVPFQEIIPQIKITTFGKWDEINEWLYNLSKTAGSINKEMKKIVDNLKTDNKIEFINRLYSYVRDKIRYVGIELGIGGIKPRNSISVFTSKYGDCKDKATLLNSLLNYAGFKSYLGLVRTDSEGKVEFNLPSSTYFNHAISVVKMNNKFIFLDPTANYFHMSEFPYSDRLNKIFLINKRKAKFVSPPPIRYSDNVSKSFVNITLHDDLSADIKKKILNKGEFAPTIRYFSENKHQHKKYIEAQWNAVYPGTVLLLTEYSNIQNKIPAFKYSILVNNFAVPDGSYIKFKPFLEPSQIYDSYCSLNERKFDLIFSFPYVIESKIIINMYKNSRVLLPKNLIINNSFLYYKLTFRVIGKNRIEINKLLRLKKNRIKPEDYRTFKTAALKIKLKENEYIKIKK